MEVDWKVECACHSAGITAVVRKSALSLSLGLHISASPGAKWPVTGTISILGEDIIPCV